MTILALDPGVTTGYVIEYTNRAYAWGQCNPDAIWELLSEVYHEDPEQLTIVCESFEYRRHQTHAVLTPVEVIGVVKEFVRQHNNLALQFQSPAQAKHYWTDDRLKQLDLWFKGMQHARDAARHLLYYRYFGGGKGQYGQVPC